MAVSMEEEMNKAMDALLFLLQKCQVSRKPHLLQLEDIACVWLQFCSPKNWVFANVQIKIKKELLKAATEYLKCPKCVIIQIRF